MFFRRGPKMEEVRSQLVQLIVAAFESLDREMRQKKDPPGYYSATIFVVRAEDLVPRARNIITPQVAQKIERSYEQAQMLIGDEVIAFIPEARVDFYLMLVLLTVEAVLGQTGPTTRFLVSDTGQLFHTMKGGDHLSAGRYTDAEAEFRQALRYNEISPGVVEAGAWSNIGISLLAQGRIQEAQEAYNTARTILASYRPEALSYDSATAAVENLKAYLDDTGL